MPAETHVEQGPIGRDEVLGIVKDQLAGLYFGEIEYVIDQTEQGMPRVICSVNIY